MSNNTLTLTLKVDDKGSIVVGNFSKKFSNLTDEIRESSGPIGKLSARFNKLKSVMGGVGNALFSLKGLLLTGAAGLGIYKLAGAMENASRMAAEEQKQTMQLQAVMISMHRNVKGFTQSMIALANAQELQSGYGNEVIMSAEHMLATFSTISNKAMPAVLKTTEDLARGWGIDLTQAARIMGVASMGLVGELTRYGITLSAQSRKTKNFKYILRDIQEQVSGSAEAFRYSSDGIRTTFESVLDDSKKLFGKLENNVLDPFFEGATQMINQYNKKFKSIGNNQDSIRQLQATVITVVDNMVHAFAFLYNATIDVAKGFADLKFVIQGFAYVEDTMLGIFSKKYAKRAAEFKKSSDETKKQLTNLGKAKISTKGIDDFLKHYKKAVFAADKKIAAVRKKDADKTIKHLDKKENTAALASATKRFEVEKSLDGKIKKLSMNKFTYQKYLLGQEVVKYQNQGVKITEIQQYASLRYRQILQSEMEAKKAALQKSYNYQLSIADLTLKNVKNAWSDLKKQNIDVTGEIKDKFANAYSTLLQTAAGSIDQIKAIWDSMKQHNIAATDAVKQATLVRLTAIVSANDATVKQIDSAWDFMKTHNISATDSIKNKYVDANLAILSNSNSTADQISSAWNRLKNMQLSAINSFSAGWNYAISNFKNESQIMMDFGQQTAKSLQSSLSDTFLAGFEGHLNSVKGIFKSFVGSIKQSFLRMLADIAAQKIMMYFKGAWAGNPGGEGPIEKLLGINVPFLTFAAGGVVPGSWNGQEGFAGDSVPAMLTPGEYVVRRDVARNYLPQLKAINSDEGGAGSVASGKNIPDLMGMIGLNGGGIVNSGAGHYGFFHFISHIIHKIGHTIGSIVKGVGKVLGKITKFIHKSALGKILFTAAEIGADILSGGTLTPALLMGMGVGGGMAAIQGGGLNDILTGSIMGGATAEITAGAGQIISGGKSLVQVGGRWQIVDSAKLTTLPGSNSAILASANGEDIMASLPKTTMQGIWGIAKQTGADAFTNLVNLPKTAFDSIKNLTSSSWSAVKSQGIKGLTETAWSNIKKLPTGIWDAMKKLPTTAWNALRNFNPLGYITEHLTEILSHFRLSMGGASGGQALGNIGKTMGIGKTLVAHSGGLLQSVADEMMVIAKNGEYMIRPEAVRSVSPQNLDYINATGQIPGGTVINLNGPLISIEGDNHVFDDQFIEKLTREVRTELRNLEELRQ